MFMFLPQANISGYRKQYASINQSVQLLPTLCNEDVRNPRMIGVQTAMSNDFIFGEGNCCGYGCYQSGAVCNCCNIYCPVYYNQRSAYQPNNTTFNAN